MVGKIRPSDIEEYDTYAEIIIRTRSGEEKERAIIDLEDISLVEKYRWCTTDKGYVKRTFFNGKKWKNLYLHRYIMSPEKDIIVDHINQNPLDNRRKNLRLADFSLNRTNCKISTINTSGKAGVNPVYWGKWFAKIAVYKKLIPLGYFENKKDAIKARIEAEKKYGVVVDG